MSGCWEMSQTRMHMEEEFSDKLQDAEMNALLDDLLDVLHAYEWWYAGDTGERDYREAVRAFKRKWFERTPEVRARFYADLIDETAERCKRELGIGEET